MIEILFTILKMIAIALPFVLLCIFIKGGNLQKPERSKQFFMPVIAFFYVIFAINILTRLSEAVNNLLDAFPKWLDSLSQVSWMPNKLEILLLNISNWIRDVFSKINLTFFVFLLVNIILVLIYLLIKKICVTISAMILKDGSVLHNKVAGIFYEYFAEKGRWCLKEEYVQTRKLLKVFYYFSVFFAGILIVVSSKLYIQSTLKGLFYPVLSVLIIGEMYFLLDGTTRREYLKTVLGEDEDSYKQVNYSLLRRFLRSIFGDKLLSENTSVNNALLYEVTNEEIIRELEKNEDPKISTFAIYVKALNATGFDLDHNYLSSTIDLLNGKSILFNNPFYNDLIPYAFYPMNRMLLSHKKVLVVLGRHAIEDDIEKWIESGIEAITNIPFLWNVGILGNQEQELDIGIITRSDVLNMELHRSNEQFLSEVGYVVIIEPSKLISTAQIGLNLLIKRCRTEEENELVYCLCDKNCDGLVDAMSHILMTSITEVAATKKHLGTSSYMCWEADNDYLHHRIVPNISRYLGLGTELSFAALKNQVSKVQWYGGESFPVTDINWIDKQYYYDLMKYAGLPTSQDAMDDHFKVSSNFWGAGAGKNNYFTVEDESFNMFEILRNFSTRSSEQGFVNVISSEYLLKDYMADNATIFEADAKAIPNIVADYARTNRNTILRLVLMMSTNPTSSRVIEKELSLLGMKIFNLKQQLWYEIYCCYTPVNELSALTGDYMTDVETVADKEIEYRTSEGKKKADISLFRVDRGYNLDRGEMETTYQIKDESFLSACVSELKSAGYVAEDEKGDKNYFGSELRGHIYQKYLPGQFFTFAGKYYEMQYLTAHNQVLVRRAADHINGRPAYRQIREYTIRGIKDSDQIGAIRNISGMKVSRAFADILVDTPGYYHMEKYNDFKSAKKVCYEGEKNGIPTREYCNKQLLCIEFPEEEGRFTNLVRYTITTLMNEVFRTLFAENQAYICALTDTCFMKQDCNCNPLTYNMKAENFELKQNAIYIVEDSQLDLGLLITVERNLDRILQIIHDYIDWHKITLENSLTPPPEPKPPVIFEENEEDDEEGGKKKKKGFFRRIIEAIKGFFKKIWEWIKNLFKKKPKKPKDDTRDNDESDATEEADPNEGDAGVEEEDMSESGENTETDETTKEDESDDEVITEEEIKEVNMPMNDPKPMDVGKEDLSSVFIRKPYHERYYALYGDVDEPTYFDLVATLKYLSEIGYDNNPLKQAREGKNIAEYVEATFNPAKAGARYCDFCGTEIYGVEYETLADGRDRCMICGRTAIKTEEEFRKIFEDVKRNMESFFGIKINVGIRVEMVNAKKLHKRLGHAFIPTPKADGRILGVAISDKNGYTLMVENGSPRMASMLTMAHELTHIWQYINWNDKEIRKKYGKELRLQIYEGMAKWVEIQYAYLINEPARAKREEIITSYRQDEYGFGFLRYLAQYPFSLGTVITKPTPFMNIETPLDMEYCGPITPTYIHAGDDIIDEDTDDNSYEPTERKPKEDESKDDREPLKGKIERTPGEIKYYVYETLTEDEKEVYDLLVNAISHFDGEITELPTGITSEQIFRLSEFVQCDHPELFWFQYGTKVITNSGDSTVVRIVLSYRMTEEEAKECQKRIDAEIGKFLSSIEDDMSDFQVALKIYENIIKLVDYDSIGLDKQKREATADSGPDELRSIYGVIVNKKAVCAGYAKATQYLMNLCGIECTYVVSKTHAWNLIKLEGEYYHLDTTWGDHSNTDKKRSESNTISYDCFCITTKDLEKLDEHKLAVEFDVPECCALDCNYFYRFGQYFEEYDFTRIRNLLCKMIRQGKSRIGLKAANSGVYKKMNQELIQNNRFREILQYANMQEGIHVSSMYSYVADDKKNILTFIISNL